MRSRVVIACALAVLAAAGLVAQNPRPAPAPDAPAGGRYQLIVNQNGSPQYLFEPATGRVWSPLFREDGGPRERRRQAVDEERLGAAIHLRHEIHVPLQLLSNAAAKPGQQKSPGLPDDCRCRLDSAFLAE